MDIYKKIELDRKIQNIRDRGFCIETGNWDNKEKLGPYARIFNSKGSYFQVHCHKTSEECLRVAVENWEEKKRTGQLQT